MSLIQFVFIFVLLFFDSRIVAFDVTFSDSDDEPLLSGRSSVQNMLSKYKYNDRLVFPNYDDSPVGVGDIRRLDNSNDGRADLEKRDIVFPSNDDDVFVVFPISMNKLRKAESTSPSRLQGSSANSNSNEGNDNKNRNLWTHLVQPLLYPEASRSQSSGRDRYSGSSSNHRANQQYSSSSRGDERSGTQKFARLQTSRPSYPRQNHALPSQTAQRRDYGRGRPSRKQYVQTGTVPLKDLYNWAQKYNWNHGGRRRQGWN